MHLPVTTGKVKGMRQKVTPTQRALNLWAVILIIWAVYRAKIKAPEVIDEFIAKPLVFILPVWYYVTKVEKQDFFKGIYLDFSKLKEDVILGTVIGGIFFFSAALASFLQGGSFVKLIALHADIQFIALMIAIALATAISEEILSRGFILKRLYEESKNMYTSSFFASILFFFLHVPFLFANAKITGNLLLVFLATDMILSLTNSFLFLTRRSLILPIMIHMFYNLTIILFIAQ